mgnify:CR=1 FL=1
MASEYLVRVFIGEAKVKEYACRDHRVFREIEDLVRAGAEFSVYKVGEIVLDLSTPKDQILIGRGSHILGHQSER